MSWEPELEELRRREELARRMGGEERVARQHESGRLTVRERIERLFDTGTFHETGAIAGRADYDDGELVDFLPANCVVGQGRIDGRRAVVQGDDFTVRGGAADAAIWQKMVFAERTAHDMRIPLVRLVDGTGGPFEARGDGRARRDGQDLMELWDEIAEAVSRVIDRLTFGELAERVRERESAARPMYHI